MCDERLPSGFAGLPMGTKILAGVLLLLGITAAVLGIYFSAAYTQAKPVLMSSPDAAQQQVVAMMDEVCAGEFSKASAYILGNPSLGADREASGVAAAMIWDAFVESTAYELSGPCYVTDDGLAQDITFTCLDMSSVHKNLRQRAQSLLEQRIAAAEDTSAIYDENHEYREDVVNAVLEEAVAAALKEDATTITTTVAVCLKYENGKWMIVADQELLDVLFGDVLFYATSSEQ